MDSAALDFRAAQDPEALAPRDGPRYSSDVGNLVGDVHLVSPLDGSSLGLPTTLSVTIRVSWAPAHLNIVFVNNGVRQKIAFRPVKERVSYWYGIDYEPNLFTLDVKKSIPDMFYIPSEGQKRDTTIPAPTENQTFEPSQGWNDWYNDWNSWSDNEWEVDGSDEKSDSPKNDDREKSATPELKAEEKSESTTAVVEEVIVLGPPPKTPPPEPVLVAETAPPIPGLNGKEEFDARPPVNVEASIPLAEFKHFTSDTASVEDNRHSVSEAPSGASRFQEDFQRLQVTSATGPPATLVQRYERQQIANRLSLDPIVYNLLVFGEFPPCQQP